MLKETYEQDHLKQIVAKNGEVYELLELIGQGGMGVVYKAHQVQLDRIVAVKMLHRHIYQSASAIERLRKEANATEKLTHPSIVRIFSLSSTEQNEPFLVLEYVPGQTLAKRLGEQGKIVPANCVKIFRQVLEALQCAHQSGFVHRDLKPANIMVDDEMKAKLMDFGIAKALEENADNDPGQATSGNLIGSPSYMSPEQCKGETLDARSDIYSAGCVLYEMLTAVQLFPSESGMEAMYRHTYDLPDLNDGQLDLRFKPLIFKSVEKNPEDRYQTAAEFLSDLEDCNKLSKFAFSSAKLPLLSPIPGSGGGRKAKEKSGIKIAVLLALACLLGLLLLITIITQLNAHQSELTATSEPTYRSLRQALEIFNKKYANTNNNTHINEEEKRKRLKDLAGQLEAEIEIGIHQREDQESIAHAESDLAARLNYYWPERSREWYNKALACYAGLSNYGKQSEKYTSILLDLANTYRQPSELPQARKAFTEVIKLRMAMAAASPPASSLVGDAYHVYAERLKRAKQYQEAEYYALKAAGEYVASGWLDGTQVIDNYELAARLQRDQQEYQRMLDTTQKAINFLEKMKNARPESSNYYGLYSSLKIYERRMYAAFQLQLPDVEAASYKQVEKLAHQLSTQKAQEGQEAQNLLMRIVAKYSVILLEHASYACHFGAYKDSLPTTQDMLKQCHNQKLITESQWQTASSELSLVDFARDKNNSEHHLDSVITMLKQAIKSIDGE